MSVGVNQADRQWMSKVLNEFPMARRVEKSDELVAEAILTCDGVDSESSRSEVRAREDSELGRFGELAVERALLGRELSKGEWGDAQSAKYDYWAEVASAEPERIEVKSIDVKRFGSVELLLDLAVPVRERESADTEADYYLTVFVGRMEMLVAGWATRDEVVEYPVREKGEGKFEWAAREYPIDELRGIGELRELL